MAKNYILKCKLATSLFLQLFFIGILSAQQTLVTDTFHYTGSTQTFVIPSCAGPVTLQVSGAMGGIGSGFNAWSPGYGGYVEGVLTPSPGMVLYLNIGGMGTGSVGGFNGGGNGGQGFMQYGGGGGGGADIRIGGNAFSNRVIVAGGGGGGGSTANSFGGAGGNFMSLPCGINGVGGEGGWGTNNNGGNSGSCAGGTGSLQSGGAGAGLSGGGALSGIGAGSYGQAGSLGQGGNGGGVIGIYGGGGGGVNGAGGGGGGYYGGAGAMSGTLATVTMFSESGGGGGGSSYADHALFSNITFSGTGTADGLIVIRYFLNGPEIFASASSLSICNGVATTLSAGGVSSYTWLPVDSFTGSNTSSITVAPPVSTTYTVTGTNSSGCISQSVIAITVNVSPTITISSSPDNTVCLGETVILTAASANNFIWTNSVNSATSSAPSLIIYPNVTTVYSVSSNNINGCISKTSIQLVVSECTSIQRLNNGSPSIKIYPNPNIGSFNLWSDSDIKLSVLNQLGECVKKIELNGQNERLVTVNNLTEGIYFITRSNDQSTITQKVIVMHH